jgi:hypothetical protein
VSSSKNQKEVLKEKKRFLSNFDYIRIICILNFFKLIIQGLGLVEASLQVGEKYIALSKAHDSLKYFAKLIRKWSRFFLHEWMSSKK